MGSYHGSFIFIIITVYVARPHIHEDESFYLPMKRVHSLVILVYCHSKYVAASQVHSKQRQQRR